MMDLKSLLPRSSAPTIVSTISGGRPLAWSAQRAAAAHLSFSELAKSRAEPLLATIFVDAEVLDERVSPGDPSLVALGGRLARLRDTLALFMHVWRAPHQQEWQRAYELIERGREVIGHFNDLHGNANAALGAARLARVRREMVLAWRTELLEHDCVASMTLLIANPSRHPHTATRTPASSSFWGLVSIAPDPALSGVQNLKALAAALVEESRDMLSSLLSAAVLQTVETQAAFRGMKNHLRSIVALAATVPEILDDARRAEPLLESVAGFDKRLGAVEDRLTGLHVAMDERDVLALPEHMAAMDEAWDALRVDIVGKRLVDTLRVLGALV